MSHSGTTPKASSLVLDSIRNILRDESIPQQTKLSEITEVLTQYRSASVVASVRAAFGGQNQFHHLFPPGFFVPSQPNTPKPAPLAMTKAEPAGEDDDIVNKDAEASKAKAQAARQQKAAPAPEPKAEAVVHDEEEGEDEEPDVHLAMSADVVDLAMIPQDHVDDWNDAPEDDPVPAPEPKKALKAGKSFSDVTVPKLSGKTVTVTYGPGLTIEIPIEAYASVVTSERKMTTGTPSNDRLAIALLYLNILSAFDADELSKAQGTKVINVSFLVHQVPGKKAGTSVKRLSISQVDGRKLVQGIVGPTATVYPGAIANAIFAHAKEFSKKPEGNSTTASGKGLASKRQ